MESNGQRPSKKQHELLGFIEKFIAEHGYGPSYREIMNGCNYSSVATVALHVNNLIKKGRLRKKDRSARSLEIVGSPDSQPKGRNPSPTDDSGKKWLLNLIDQKLANVAEPPQRQAKIQKFAQALKVLGFEDIAEDLKNRS